MGVREIRMGAYFRLCSRTYGGLCAYDVFEVGCGTKINSSFFFTLVYNPNHTTLVRAIFRD